MANKTLIAFLALAGLMAGAYSIQCYTSSLLDVQISDNGNTVTFPGKIDTFSSSYTSCLSVELSGSGSYGGINLKGSGKDGEGSDCTCTEWDSATGCNGQTKDAYIASQKSSWGIWFAGTGSIDIKNFACCSTNLCNTGIEVKLSSAALPLVNMMTLLATALVGYIFTAKLL